MKKVTCALTFSFLLLTVSLIGQEIPVLETEIGVKYSFTEQELAEDKEFRDLYEKYASLIWGSEEDKKQIPEKDKRRLESLMEKKGEDWEYVLWSTDPMGCSWYCGGYHFQTVSSSVPNTINNCYDANAIFDLDVRTAWIEGVEGYGIGEYVEVHFPMNFASATVCHIVNGYNKNERTWKDNSRVKKMNLYIDDKLVGVVNLKDTRDDQYFQLPDTIPNLSDTTRFEMKEIEGNQYKVSTLKLLITDVYPGDKYDDTAISELYFDGIGVHCLAEGTAVMISCDSIICIEEVKVGDRLYTYNIERNDYEMKPVKRIHQVKHSELYQIILSDGGTITVTDDHPFYTIKGWVSINPTKTRQYKKYSTADIQRLNVGSQLLSVNSKAKEVVDIELIKEPTNTYTLEFEEDQVAFVANGILVGQE